VERDPDQAPDIVLVVIDTLRADHLGVYGYERATSPAIDALAAEGLWFSRAYAHSGWTLPSFSSLLTGTLPHQHRMGRAESDTKVFSQLPRDQVTLAERLSDQGYACAAIVNNTFLAPQFGLNQGFDPYDYQGSGVPAHRSAEDTVDIALKWLERTQEPAFLLVHIMEPHLPLDPSDEVRGTFASTSDLPIPVPYVANPTSEGWKDGSIPPPGADVRQALLDLYDEEILSSDRAVGRLVTTLKDQGRWDNLALIVTADHGEEYFDHGGFEHGHSLFGELTRVPLVMAGGALLRQGQVDDVVQHIDLAPTLLALAGGDPVPELTGANLWTLPQGTERATISENCLYRRGCLSAVDKDVRVRINPTNGGADAWLVSATGAEDVQVQGDAAQQLVNQAGGYIVAVRGDLEPLQTRPGPQLDSPELFQQLGALGYLVP
jgi:arylsulfatase A-like enzyme